MKKIIALLCALSVPSGVTACGKGEEIIPFETMTAEEIQSETAVSETLPETTEESSLSEMTISEQAEKVLAVNYHATSAYAAILLFQMYAEEDISISPQVINCEDWSGAVTEGLAEALAEYMPEMLESHDLEYAPPYGELFIDTQEINGENQILVQWRESEDAELIGQCPVGHFNPEDTVVWGTFTSREWDTPKEWLETASESE